jgi:hypothetical protein
VIPSFERDDVPTEPKFDIGDKVVGSGHFRGLRGKVVDFKESGFGLRFAEVRRKDGTKEWARTIFLKLKGET